MKLHLTEGTIRFEHADHNHDGMLESGEWEKHLANVEKFRERYESHGLLAVRLDSDGLVDEDGLRTLATRNIPEVPSPVSDGKYVYLLKNGGVLTCLDVKSGERIYQMRTPGRGTHYASPFIADGKLFCVAGDGKISVVSTGPDPEVLATNDMQEGVFASPRRFRWNDIRPHAFRSVCFWQAARIALMRSSKANALFVRALPAFGWPLKPHPEPVLVPRQD